MIKPKPLWHSPLQVYYHIDRLTEQVGKKVIESRGRYGFVQECRVGAVLALCMFMQTGKPTYLQLHRPDPPDLFLMQISDSRKGQLDLMQVEVTSYLGVPEEDLLTQLKRTKLPEGWHKYSSRYILLTHLGIGFEVNYRPISNYLKLNKSPFPLMVIQEIQEYPDTISALDILDPEWHRLEINVGEAAYRFKQLKLPDLLRTVRVGDPKKVGIERNAHIKDVTPWESLI